MEAEPGSMEHEQSEYIESLASELPLRNEYYASPHHQPKLIVGSFVNKHIGDTACDVWWFGLLSAIDRSSPVEALEDRIRVFDNFAIVEHESITSEVVVWHID